MTCELCGKGTSLTRAVVEGVEMTVCKTCSGFGKILQTPVFQQKKITPKLPETISTIVPDAGELVRKARERLGLTQKDFALKINEHQSTIYKVETGHLEPNMMLAKKLERNLGVNLIEENEEVVVSSLKTKSAVLTIGDMIKLKE